MPHIQLPEGVPGIRGPLAQYPETGKPLMALAQALLRGPSPLAMGERELIAAYVSALNDCAYCSKSHGAAARELLEQDALWVDEVLALKVPETLGSKMKAILKIAAQVQKNGHGVTEAEIAEARMTGATDREIHDAVLISAAFCMYNRYVDGLGTLEPDHPAAYPAIGKRLAEVGYA